jgi:hypothetical protein
MTTQEKEINFNTGIVTKAGKWVENSLTGEVLSAYYVIDESTRFKTDIALRGFDFDSYSLIGKLLANS